MSNFSIEIKIAFKNYITLKSYCELTKTMLNDYNQMKNNYNNITKDYIQKITQLGSNYSKAISHYKSMLELSGGELNELIQLFEKIESMINSQADKLQSFLKGCQVEEAKNKINQEIRNNFEKFSNDFLIKEKKMTKAYNDFENCVKNLFNSYNMVESTLAINILSKDNRKISLDDFVNQDFNNAFDKEKIFLKTKEDISQIKNEFFKSYDEMINIEKNICSENIQKLKSNINCFVTLYAYFFKNFTDNLENIIEDIVNIEKKMRNSNIIDSLIGIVGRDIYISGYRIKVINNRYIEDKNKKLNLDKLDKKGYLIKNNKVNLKDEDIYEIVKIMYGQFQFIEQKSYNLIEEQIKINVKNITRKLLSFDDKTKLFDLEKLEPVNESEINLLFKYLEKSQNRLEFLKVLNLFRAKGKYKIPEREFEILKKVFLLIADKICNEKDRGCSKLILILSQTFYTKKDDEDKDIYIQNFLKNHEMMSKVEIWEKYLNDSIEQELNRTEKIEKKENSNLAKNNEQNIKYKTKNILNSQLLPFCDNMCDFGMSKENIYKIIDPIMDKYQVKDDLKDTIDDLIKSKLSE